MPAPTISQKGRPKPLPRRDAPKAMTAAKPQAKICRRFARKDPAVAVPSVAASQRCSATMTAARIRGFRAFLVVLSRFKLNFLLESILWGILRASAQSLGKRALPDTGRYEGIFGGVIPFGSNLSS